MYLIRNGLAGDRRYESLSLRQDLVSGRSGKSKLLEKTPDNTGVFDFDHRKPMSNSHGFRGLASTLLHEREYPHEHIELQLAHAPRNAVSAAYNHAQHLKGRAKMMQDWADFLEHAQRGAKMLSFPERTA
jgi:integrase